MQLLSLSTMQMCIEMNSDWQEWARNQCMVLRFEMLWVWSSFWWSVLKRRWGRVEMETAADARYPPSL